MLINSYFYMKIPIINSEYTQPKVFSSQIDYSMGYIQ